MSATDAPTATPIEESPATEPAPSKEQPAPAAAPSAAEPSEEKPAAAPVEEAAPEVEPLDEESDGSSEADRPARSKIEIKENEELHLVLFPTEDSEITWRLIPQSVWDAELAGEFAAVTGWYEERSNTVKRRRRNSEEFSKWTKRMAKIYDLIEEIDDCLPAEYAHRGISMGGRPALHTLPMALQSRPHVIHIMPCPAYV